MGCIAYLASKGIGVRVLVDGDLANFRHIQAVVVPDNAVSLILLDQDLVSLHIAPRAVVVHQGIYLQSITTS